MHKDDLSQLAHRDSVVPDSRRCQTGFCPMPALYHTHFFGGCFLDLCEQHELELFPPEIFKVKGSTYCIKTETPYENRNSEAVHKETSGG